MIVREPPVEIPGPEDIVIDHAASIAFVASQQRMSSSGKLLSVEDMPGGSLVALNLTQEPPAKRRLVDQNSLGFTFHPRGCGYFAGTNGERRLMVISDRTTAHHVIEIFDVVGNTLDSVGLQHIQTIADDEHLISPNDLVALDKDRFYVTNDHGTRGALLQLLETGAALPWSTVAFWDGSHFTTVAREIVFANGIALDHDRGRLYVASTRSKKVHVFGWNANDPAKELIETDEIALPGCPDNLEWDEEGNLWIGSDPDFFKLFLYCLGVLSTAPSQLICVRFCPGEKPWVEEAWRDESGETISASSVAAVHGKGPVRRLLIGQPFGNFLRDCELRSL